MIKRTRRLMATFAVALALTLPATAEFLSPNWSGLNIKGVDEPDWIVGVQHGAYIGMCVTCDGTLMLQVQVLPDDGTGSRVRSGETTAESYTALGAANAAQLGGTSAYYGTKLVNFASAVGFKTRARTAAGDYSATYQLWSDGQQLVVKVYGKDQSIVDTLAERVFGAAAPQTFR